jgi:predicted kinase
MNPPGHRAVGWSILFAMARAQLRRGSSVVLDGVARMAEIAECRDLADEEGVSLFVVVTDCSDLELHRSRVEGRRRGIPGWYEVDWDSVQRSRATWEPIEGGALMLDAIHPIQSNVDRLVTLLGRTVNPAASPTVTGRSVDKGGGGVDQHDR